MYCSKCGVEVKKDAKFCYKCGSAVLEIINNTDENEKFILRKNQNKLSLGMMFAYGVELLSIIISLFLPICAQYYEYGKGKVRVSHRISVFSSSWAYVDSNYNVVSQPNTGQTYAKLFAFIFLAIAIFCFFWSILKDKRIIAHIITIITYFIFSGATLHMAREYFKRSDFKFTGIHNFAVVLMILSFVLLVIFCRIQKSKKQKVL